MGFVLLLGVVVYVFFGFDALPFMDLPAHAGLIALRHRYSGSPFDQSYFLVVPHVGPYSAFRSLGGMLAAIGGPIAAVRGLALLPAIGTPLAVSWARWRLHGEWRPGLGAMAVALSFGLMTAFGFAGYLLGVTTSIVGLTLWLELVGAHEATARQTSIGMGGAARRRVTIAGAFLAVFAPVVFLCHGHAFLLLLTVSCASLAAPPWRARRFLMLSVYAPAISLAAYSTYCERAASSSLTSLVSCTNSGMHFQSLGDKLSLLLTPTLITRVGPDVLVGLAIWAALTVASARSVKRTWTGLTIADFQSRALTLGVVILGIAFAILPHTIGWFGFVDGRLVLPLLLFALVGIRTEALGSRLTRILGYVGAATGCVQIGIVLIASSYFQREASGYKEVLERIPARTRLLDLPIEPNSRVFGGHPFVHYGMLALVDKPILASDIWYHQGTAVFPRAGNPAFRLPSGYCESDMRSVDWASFRLEDWDYVLIRQNPSAATPLVPATMTLVSHRGGWWLWRITADSSSDT
jgi:hypothetical protein